MIHIKHSTLAITGLLAIAGAAATTSAQPLTGSGKNLPVASPTAPAAVARDAVLDPGGRGWTGSWSAGDVAAPWVGSFGVSGQMPAGAGTLAGVSEYDFSTMPGSVLSTGTFFRFGDVDGGSRTNETFTLRAWDTGGSLITTPWLDVPIATTGIGTGGGRTILPGNTPGWSWDAITGEYFIDGSTVTGGNPSIGNWLESNRDITMLSVNRTSTAASFSLAAPVPAPGAVALFGLAGLVAARRRR